MELFPLYGNVLVALAIVGGLATAVWFVMELYWVRSREQEEELPEITLPGHVHEVLSGIPGALWAFYAMMAIALILYVLLVVLGGATY